jgi:hypothetical protein
MPGTLNCTYLVNNNLLTITVSFCEDFFVVSVKWIPVTFVLYKNNSRIWPASLCYDRNILFLVTKPFQHKTENYFSINKMLSISQTTRSIKIAKINVLDYVFVI